MVNPIKMTEMNTYSIKSLTLILCVVLLSACKGDEKFPDFMKSSLPKLTIQESSDFVIQNDAFAAKVTVDLLFKDYPKNAKVVIQKNGDNSTVKVIKENVTTFPNEIAVSSSLLTELYGEPMKIGDYVEIGMDVQLESNLWVPAFNKNGLSSSPQADQLPGSNPVVKFKTVVPFAIDAFVGTAEFEDGFIEKTYDVTVEKKSDLVLVVSGMYGMPAPYGVVELTIDPKRHTVSADKAMYAPSFALPGLEDYADFEMNSIRGDLDSFNHSIAFSATVTCDAGSFGSASFSFKMK